MKILLIAYYFDPCNSIAANRTNSFYHSLTDAGHVVDVVTRGWEGDESNWNDYIKSSSNKQVIERKDRNNTIYYLPYVELKLPENAVVRKLNILWNFLNGNFTSEADTCVFINFIFDFLKKGEFHTVIVSSPPINIAKLGYLMKVYFPHLRLIVDFRDLQNHILLSKKPEVSIAQIIEHHCIKFYLKRWLKIANYILIASEPFGVFLKEMGFKSTLLLNGFEKKILISNTNKKYEKFAISILGTLYPHQELTFFIETLKLFLIDKSPKNVVVNLIGVNVIPSVAKKFEEELKDFAFITNKIPRSDALKIGRESAVLAYPGWKGYHGMYSGKIFEYLALRKHILIAPSDNDVKEKLVIECNAGKAVNTIEEGRDYLNECFQLWIRGKLILKNNENKIEKYSREEQNKVLLNLINNG